MDFKLLGVKAMTNDLAGGQASITLLAEQVSPLLPIASRENPS